MAKGLKWICLVVVAAAGVGCRASDAGSFGADASLGPDAGSARAVGAPCVVDADCAGACLRDLADPALGRRCFAPCGPEDRCLPGERCVAGRDGGRGCVRAQADPAEVGADCTARRCADGLECTADHPDGVICAPVCDDSTACPDGTRCPAATVSPRVCLPGDAPVFRCPVVPCLRTDLRCFVDEEGGSACVQPCGDIGADCPGGGRCEREPSGAGVCRPTADRGLGESCTSGGDAACSPGLICAGEGPGDPDAFCSRACAGPADCCPDCVEAFACRAELTGDRICVAAPYGIGDEAGAPGADCAAHGLTDCAPGLICAAGVAGAHLCARRCEGGCPPETHCVARPEGAVCFPGAAGAPGSPCPTGSECPVCLGAQPAERYCSVDCDVGGSCPPGFGCRDGRCRIGAAGLTLGASCGADGAEACESGLCVTAAGGGEAVCSQPCDVEPCPSGFDCVAVDGLDFCLPGAD